MWSLLALQEEIRETFDAFATCIDVADIGAGMHRHEHLTMLRATVVSRTLLTDEQRRGRRAALEARRRAYKTEKQREYRARATA